MLLTRYGFREWGLAAVAAVVVLLVVTVTAFGYPGDPLPAWIILGAVAFGWFVVAGFFRDPIRRIPRDLPEGTIFRPPTASSVQSNMSMPMRRPTDNRPSSSGSSCRYSTCTSIVPHATRTVLGTVYRKGKFLNAQTPESAWVNESNVILLEFPDGEAFGMRQVSGMIARCIVCPLQKGDTLTQGCRWGMIKFGSTTELILPRPDDVEVHARRVTVSRGEPRWHSCVPLPRHPELPLTPPAFPSRWEQVCRCCLQPSPLHWPKPPRLLQAAMHSRAKREQKADCSDSTWGQGRTAHRRRGSRGGRRDPSGQRFRTLPSGTSVASAGWSNALTATNRRSGLIVEVHPRKQSHLVDRRTRLKATPHILTEIPGGIAEIPRGTSSCIRVGIVASSRQAAMRIASAASIRITHQRCGLGVLGQLERSRVVDEDIDLPDDRHRSGAGRTREIELLHRGDRPVNQFLRERRPFDPATGITGVGQGMNSIAILADHRRRSTGADCRTCSPDRSCKSRGTDCGRSRHRLLLRGPWVTEE